MNKNVHENSLHFFPFYICSHISFSLHCFTFVGKNTNMLLLCNTAFGVLLCPLCALMLRGHRQPLTAAKHSCMIFALAVF